LKTGINPFVIYGGIVKNISVTAVVLTAVDVKVLELFLFVIKTLPKDSFSLTNLPLSHSCALRDNRHLNPEEERTDFANAHVVTS